MTPTDSLSQIIILIDINFVWPAKCYIHAGIFMTLPINIFCKFKDRISLFITVCFVIILITLRVYNVLLADQIAFDMKFSNLSDTFPSSIHYDDIL